MVFQNNILAGASYNQPAFQVSRSLRFNTLDSANLSRTLGTATSQGTYTFSCWVKRCKLGVDYSLFGTSANDRLCFNSGNTISVILGGTARATTTGIFRDCTSWYHIVYTQNGNAITVYVNGTSVATGSNASLVINTAVAHRIGAAAAGAYFDGYMCEVYFIDGQALTPSSFAQTDGTTGVWSPIKYSGTYGTNGAYLKFADNTSTTTLGTDSSTNANSWTANNFSVTAGSGNDSLVDTPTNYGTDTGAGGEVRGNYCVYNQLDTQATSFGTETYNNGSLDMPSQSDDAGRGTFGVNYGKWAFEVTLTSTVSGSMVIGWCTAQTDLNNYPANAAGFYYYYSGNKYISATSSSGPTSSAYGLSYTNGDVIRCEIDFTAKTIQWYKNNAGQGSVDISGALDGTTYYPCVYANNASSTINFGQRAFTNPASSGYKVLCTANLTAPTINKGSNYINTLLYTGTGASLAVTGLNFTPNFVWAKARTSATDHAWYDSVRGVQKQLESNTTTDETTETTGILSFDTNGFSTGTLAQLNTASITYASWNWLKSSTPGFDVVTYTGNGTNRTINHSVGAIPQMMFVKARSTAGADQNWAAYHSVVGNTKYLLLNSNAAQSAADSTYWNNTSPTASVFSVGTNAAVNTNNDTYVAYLWAPITGFSAFGKYTGNGSTDGPYICLGFRPALILFKVSSTTGNWVIVDNVRNTINTGSTAALFPNATNIEVGDTTYALDLLSNGFKLRNSSAVVNGSGSTYVYAAFAENPFNYSRAR